MAVTLHAAIAAHRFGLGEPDLALIGPDPQGWLLQQIGPADAQRGNALPSAAEGLRRHDAYLRALRERNTGGGGSMAETKPFEQRFAEHFRELVQADQSARLTTAATTERPFAERLALFWANHFTVSSVKGAARGLVGAFEREAIRPHIAGSFEQLSRKEQDAILMEHGGIGMAFGRAGLGYDIRLACHGLDRADNDFVVGLLGPELHPLSIIVQRMRKTKQTSLHLERLGPFFVGRVAWQSSR